MDFALVNSCRAGDIVVTQDYGVAAMALARGAYAINQDGGDIPMRILRAYSPRDILLRK